MRVFSVMLALFLFFATFICSDTYSSLSLVFNSDGSITENVSGSFDPCGYTMSYLYDRTTAFTELNNPLFNPPFMQRDIGTWIPLDSGLNNVVYAIAISGTDVYVGGSFTDAGGNPNADYIVRWDGTQWHALGTGLNGTVYAIAVSGSDVYVGGLYTDAGGNPDADRIARWDGTQWHALGTGLNSQVRAIAIMGTDVYIGGWFTDAGGSPNADYIVRWDGTQWHALGTALSGHVRAIKIMGTDVYVGGQFSDAGGNPDADRIARWDGSQWHSLGAGLNHIANAIEFLGSDVYAVGHFTDAGGNPADRIARWDGSQWHSLGAGLNQIAYAIAILGTDVYAGGLFTDAGENPFADYIARWDGTQWHALEAGLNDDVLAIALSGTDVYIGGRFTDAGGSPNANYIARWVPYRDVASIEFISPPDTVLPSVQNIIGVVTNIGSISESFTVHCIVSDQTDAKILDTTVNTFVLTGKYDTLNFGQVNMVHGQTYTLTMTTLLSGDMNYSNDTLVSQTVCPDTINAVEEDFLVDPAGISLVYSSWAFSDYKFVINLSLPLTSDVKVYFYDIAGREISFMYLEKINTGNYDLIWNCTDNNGSTISRGTYFFRLEASGHLFSGKFILAP